MDGSAQSGTACARPTRRVPSVYGNSDAANHHRLTAARTIRLGCTRSVIWPGGRLKACPLLSRSTVSDLASVLNILINLTSRHVLNRVLYIRFVILRQSTITHSAITTERGNGRARSCTVSNNADYIAVCRAGRLIEIVPPNTTSKNGKVTEGQWTSAPGPASIMNPLSKRP